jgi:hypothetical protein
MLVHDARPALIIFGEPGGLAITGWSDRVLLIDARYDGPLELPVVGPVPSPDVVPIRPDGYVAWVGSGVALWPRKSRRQGDLPTEPGGYLAKVLATDSEPGLDACLDVDGGAGVLQGGQLEVIAGADGEAGCGQVLADQAARGLAHHGLSREVGAGPAEAQMADAGAVVLLHTNGAWRSAAPAADDRGCDGDPVSFA